MFSTDGLLPRNTRIESLRLQNPFLAKELIDIKNQVNRNKLHTVFPHTISDHGVKREAIRPTALTWCEASTVFPHIVSALE